MPSRWTCLLIVGCWLATTGWLFWTEVLPDLVPGQPPPFTIDLLDEVVENNGNRRDVFWEVYQSTTVPDGDADTKPVKSHYAQTWVHRFTADKQPAWMKRSLPEDCFEIGIHLYENKWDGNKPFELPVRIHKVSSVYYVTQQGQLLATSTDASVTSMSVTINIQFMGEVVNDRFVARYRLPGVTALTNGKVKSEGDLPPVAVSHHGSVLNPLQPVTRIRGLKRGQRWQMPMVDPLADALAAAFVEWVGLDLRGLVGGHNAPLRARVLPEAQTLNWHKKEVRCLVIEYEGKDTSARTWVMEDTGLVLRQEASRDGITWIFERSSGIEDL